MGYTKEQRMKAVETFIANDFCREKTVRELGYPSPKTLSEWYYQYRHRGRVMDEDNHACMYSAEQKITAIERYYANGKNVKRTCRELGYPSRTMLVRWVMDEERIRQMQQEEEVDNVDLLSETEHLKREVALLKEEVENLRLERELLLFASEMLKKEEGIDLKALPNCVKAMVINALRKKYELSILLKKLSMARSSYYYQAKHMQVDKYAHLRQIVTQIFVENYCIYGYRRIHAKMRQQGIVVSKKVVLKIMNQEHLYVSYAKRKKFNSYQGEISPYAPNIIKHNFRADKPNEKWITDITEFKLPAGKVYLSPMLDCYDGMPVAWKIGTSPNAELANSMLDAAIATLPAGAKPIVHSDRGAHYQWDGWLKRMDAAGLTRSMSRRGRCDDNAACEGFFGRLKNEMFYGRNWGDVSLDAFSEELNAYIVWYITKRISTTLGGMSPHEYRKAQGSGGP